MNQNPIRIYFSSVLDRVQAWQTALASHLDVFELLLDGDGFDPASVDIALVWTVPDGALTAMTRLRAVLSLGAGINQIDCAQIPAHVPLARLVDASLTASMVSYARTAVLRYHRDFDVFEQATRTAQWSFMPPRANHETRIAILGAGAIGISIARALAADGFGVEAWSRTPRDEPGIDFQSGRDGLHAMVSRANIVINVLPLTAQTENILSRDLFSHFRRGARLINIGRGSHLVESDLLDALHDGVISAATLDVTRVEPLPASSPLWRHPKILVTPHVAGLSSARSAAPMIAENVRRAFRGEPLMHQVDRARGY